MVAETEAMEDSMRPKTLVAMILIAIGIMAFAYKGITYTTPGKTIDAGAVHVMTERTQNIPPTPPIGGAIALAGGLVLLLVEGKRLRHAV